MTIYRKNPVSENPTKSTWYDTDKGQLFWFSVEEEWSCMDERVSNEYPKYWLEEVELPSEEDLIKERDSRDYWNAGFLRGAKFIIDMITKTK